MLGNNEILPGNIQKSYLFQKFNQHELDAVTRIAKGRIYESGERLFEQGSIAKSLFIIGFGTVSLEVNENEEYESHPVVLGSSETFGESHYHLREKHLATAIVKERSEIYEVNYDDLSNILENIPSAELKFTKALALHLGRYCHHLIEGMMGRKVRIFVNEGISSFV